MPKNKAQRHLPPTVYCGAGRAGCWGDGGTSSFYVAGTVPSTPGILISSEDINGVTLPSSASDAKRILYSSTDGISDDSPIAVSGQFYFPKAPFRREDGPSSPGSTARLASPMFALLPGEATLPEIELILNRWLDEGFAIVATDYQGLGTPGPHPYLLYRPEGYSALDAVRAALKGYDDRLRNEVVLVGQSQGSGAALGAAWLAPKYAPDIHLIGVVATGLVVQFNPKPGSAHPPCSGQLR